MASFRTLGELSRFLTGSPISDRSNQVDQKTYKNVMIILEKAGKQLFTMVQDNIDAYYADPMFTPVKYQRTGDWANSLRISDPVIEGDIAYITVYFDEALANHPSLWGGADGFVPWLMNVGWSINWSHSYRIPRLSDMEGTHYLSDAVEAFNNSNQYGLVCEIKLSDSFKSSWP